MTKYTIKLFYAIWCPHCVTFIPQWEIFKKFLKNNPGLKDTENNDITIETEEYADGAATADMEKQTEKIEGYPTIVVYKNNEERSVFDQRPSFDSLLKYFKIKNKPQSGSGVNDYYNKYLKYKAKYINLKNNF